MPELRYFDVPNFALQRSTVLPIARLAYRTLGTLNPAKDNAVLVTTGLTLSDDSNEMYFCGEDRALDPEKVFHNSDKSSRKWTIVFSVEYACAL